ncbi:hypothetical protein FNJ87_06785 [Nonlabens mediterrranea]|uniref:DNA primase n=1 Tax=Nonlabens mediterrranea TaxID=1419947 RepID=A0ABS0A3X2_9FLAO|nr:hypothetical protein BBFL7_00019 [Flavobacteria bacterium BBFL7]MBF4984047.1 hypothetical protein [Nonlabens mediterrranea]
MKNVIVDYKKLTPDVLSLLVERYPDGYGDDDIISFKNHKNELIEAVEVKTEDTKYLVKISKRLSMQMEAFDEDDYDDKDMNDPDALPDMELEQPKDQESEDDN